MSLRGSFTCGSVALVAVVAGIAGSGVIGACGSSDRSDPTGLLTTEAGPGGMKTMPVDDAGAGNDATAAAFDASAEQPAIDTLCAQAAELGKSIEGSTEPGADHLPMGGTFNPGTYTLHQLVTYSGGISDAGPLQYVDGSGDDDDGDDAGFNDAGEIFTGESATGVVQQETFVFQSSGLFSRASAVGTVDAGVGPAQITAGVYQVSGTSITFQATCPSSSTVTYSFTAVGGILELYGANGAVEIFRLIPGG